MKKKTKCKSCGTEVSATKGSVCQKCGMIFKKPIYKRAWFIILAVLVVSSVIGSGGKEDISASSNTTSEQTKEESAPEPVIEYTAVNVQEMFNLLESNALKAETTYQDSYVEITAKLSNIDSDGEYIGLVSPNDDFGFTSINCFLTTDEQKSQVLEMSVGDTVTLNGQITGIGEVLGYSLDINIKLSIFVLPWRTFSIFLQKNIQY